MVINKQIKVRFKVALLFFRGENQFECMRHHSLTVVLYIYSHYYTLIFGSKCVTTKPVSQAVSFFL